jgi:hypothetical protein
MASITSLPSGVTGSSLVLLETQTASSSATISFTSNIDSTYKEYQFHFIDIHPATDNVNFTVNFRDGGSAYDATKTSSSFGAYHDEGDSATGVNYETSFDLAQSTSAQILGIGGSIGNGDDESLSGTLQLFDPSSTTFVKHYISNIHFYNKDNYATNSFIAGYCNVTAAIDGVQFAMSSGNIDAGTIKLYGVV